ncbi:MAG: chromate efflux transporter [Spirochaetia bacterium]|nr:chromate efflux transporter [Spirochaetia bacterium]
MSNRPPPGGTTEIFLTFLKLGCISFGGPVAHIGYFHSEFVNRRKWIDGHAFADLVALCQFLPGPASSQVGIALGLSRGGYTGAIAAWFGFTLPSAVLLFLFGIGLVKFGTNIPAGALHGLKIAAVAVVAQALWTMANKLCPDKERLTIALVAATLAVALPSTIGQVAAIVFGAAAGLMIFRNTDEGELPAASAGHGSHIVAVIALVLFFALLSGLPVLARLLDRHDVRLLDAFFRAGALVFGGGHVVLPLLQSETVQSGWVSRDAFMAGYGVAQAIPGPLFTFTAYLGAISTGEPNGILGALICLAAAFLPSFLLVFGVFPFWEQLRRRKSMRSGMVGINAAVVGLLLCAFYNPVWISAIGSAPDFLIAASAFVSLVFWKIPPWAIVGLCAVTRIFL